MPYRSKQHVVDDITKLCQSIVEECSSRSNLKTMFLEDTVLYKLNRTLKDIEAVPGGDPRARPKKVKENE